MASLDMFPVSFIAHLITTHDSEESLAESLTTMSSMSNAADWPQGVTPRIKYICDRASANYDEGEMVQVVGLRDEPHMRSPALTVASLDRDRRREVPTEDFLYHFSVYVPETPEVTITSYEIDPVTGLSKREQELWTMLSEEASEVAQACQKILRHGPFSFHPKDPSTNNMTLLRNELRDVATLVEQLDHGYSADLGYFTPDETERNWERKLIYTHHQGNKK